MGCARRPRTKVAQSDACDTHALRAESNTQPSCPNSIPLVLHSLQTLWRALHPLAASSLVSRSSSQHTAADPFAPAGPQSARLPVTVGRLTCPHTTRQPTPTPHAHSPLRTSTARHSTLVSSLLSATLGASSPHQHRRIVPLVRSLHGRSTCDQPANSTTQPPRVREARRSFSLVRCTSNSHQG